MYAKPMNLADKDPKFGLSRNCLVVLEALGNSQRLVSAQDIFTWLRQHEHKGPGLTTIYRALDLLISLQMVQAVELGDGECRYEIVEPGEHHHHLICEKCRSNVHLEQCYVDELEAAIEERHGFKIKSHVLEIFGLCKECAINDSRSKSSFRSNRGPG